MNFLENISGPAGATPATSRARGVAARRAASPRRRENCSDAIAAARASLAAAGLRKGDRCVLLAPNSIAWAALDLAAMADGIIVVPLYTRQAPAELVAMMRDCQPS